MTSENAIHHDPDTEWCRASKEDLAQGLADTEKLLNQALAKQAEILAEVQSRGVFATYGYASLPLLLQHLLRLGRGEARKRAQRSGQLYPTMDGTRQMPAVAPQTCEAFADGAVNGSHVDVIGEVMAAIPAEVSAEDRAFGEKKMVDLARTRPPLEVKQLGQHILAHLDPDGKKPKDDEPAQPARELRWAWGRDHKLRIKGVLDTETGQRLESLLSPLAKPQPAIDGTRDPRSTSERRADAFAELLQHAERAIDLGTEAGETPAVMVSMTLDQLRGDDNTGQALINWESPITAEQARRMACEARIIPVVLGSNGEILNQGRETRTATRAQRRALARRDGGCVGCGRTPRWCEVHHILEWIKDNGLSDIDNLALLCGQCHRLIHHSDWQIRMGTDGRPEMIPPAWVDAERRPRRYQGPHEDPFEAQAA